MDSSFVLCNRSPGRIRGMLAGLVVTVAVVSCCRLGAQCQAPQIVSTNSSSALDPNGIRVFYSVVVSGTAPTNYSWTFFDATFHTLYSTNSASNTVSFVVGPFDPFPASFNLFVSNPCGGSGGSGS